MKRILAGSLAALAAASLLALTAQASPVAPNPVSDDALRAEPEVQPASALPAILPSTRVRAAERHAVVLDAPPASAKLYDSGAHAGTPLKVGFARDVADLADEASFRKQLAWESLEDGGHVAAVSVTSPGAAALRMGLVVGALPEGARLRFYAPDQAPIDVAASDVLKSLAINAAAGATGNAARTYWSPVVEGDTIALEIEIPAHVATAAVRVSMPTVSHLETSAARSFALPKAAAAACELDAMCYTSQWGNEINAVARIIFTDSGSSYVCSGTLLADKDTSTNIPYFLTANHCVDSQLVASTVQSFWFYNSTSCNSGARSPANTAIAPGATLLYASGITDTSFMRLTSAPPAGTGYAGWNAAASTGLGASVTGIHHPRGDLTKISFGSIAAYSVCSPSGGSGTSFTCNGAGSSGSTHYSIRWASGETEEGSSGSALFLDNGHYVIGQLYGGNGSCDSPGNDWFGRFDVAYNAGNLGQWLANTQSSSGVVPTFDYSDLWWNPSESGWGLSLVQHPTTHALYGAWYVYDAAGTPTWVVMPGGEWTTATSFSGDLYATTGPDPRGPFNPAQVTRTKVGSAHLTFSSNGSGVLQWTAWGTSGARSIVRQPFGAVDAASATNYQDLWWNASESGWGLSINQQYRTLFAVWYAYGANGQPTWYVMPGGSWTSSNTYSGTVYRTSSAPTTFLEGGPFNPGAVTRTAVGSMALTFTSSTSATMGFSIDGMTGTKTITRQPF
ncbi:MAG TPA: trypsin-like peptidase domain-containing protein [Usitatibacter sp.]|jgi:hypothetical protein|nr:trypsin-like peptidase domain-containing protein [Usitatibacter sp.]